MLNALTIDVEDWYHAHILKIDKAQWPSLTDHVLENTRFILDLLESYQQKATFFVLGCVAKKHPDLVKLIASKGHEIGSHGYWHSLVYLQDRYEFRQEIKDSKALIEDITGTQVTCFRAPSWSISENTLWALEILEEEGFTADSSIQPFATPLSGMAGMPISPFRPVVNGRKLKLVEFPPTILKRGMFYLPFAGGFYLRLMPKKLIGTALKIVNKDFPGMVYVHPWEIDLKIPSWKTSFLGKVIQYYNITSVPIKLAYLMDNFTFAPLKEVLITREWAEFSLGKDENGK